MTEKRLAQATRTNKECEQRESSEQQEQEHKDRRDHLYDALAAMPMEERIATINRMAKRMNV